MNILILGGTRFIGLAAMAELIKAGHQVTVFHRGITEDRVPADVRHIHGDRTNLSAHRAEFEALRPDVVADVSALTERHARDLVSTMSGVTGRLVVISSCDVYKNFGLIHGQETGPATLGRLTEDSPLRECRFLYREHVNNPASVFHDYEKIHVERAVLNSPIPATILRFPMVYGPGDHQHRLYSYIKRMKDRRPAILIDRTRANWRSVRGFLDNADHALATAILNPRAAGQIYNVGEPLAFTEMEWIERLASAMHWSGKIIAIPPDHLPDYLQSSMNWTYDLDLDTNRIRHQLGYREIVSFDDGLQRTIEWELANPPVHNPAAKRTPDAFDYSLEDRVLRQVLRTQSLIPQLDEHQQPRLRWI